MSKMSAYVLETCADREDWPEPDNPETGTPPEQEANTTDEINDIF